MVEARTLGRLYCTLMDERRAWQQRIHAQVFHQGCPPIRALLTRAGREALAGAELSAAGRQYVDTALRRIDELSAEIDPLLNTIDRLRPTPIGVPGAAAPLRHRLVMRGDHLGRDRRCPPVRKFRSVVRFAGAGCHRLLLGCQTLAGAPVSAGLAGAAVGGVRGGQVRCAARVPRSRLLPQAGGQARWPQR